MRRQLGVIADAEERPGLTRRFAGDGYVAYVWAMKHNPRFGKVPTHHLVVPALAADARHTDALALASVGGPMQLIAKLHPRGTASFRLLVAQSVRVYAEFHRVNVHHLRKLRMSVSSLRAGTKVIIARQSSGVSAPVRQQFEFSQEFALIHQSTERLSRLASVRRSRTSLAAQLAFVVHPRRLCCCDGYLSPCRHR